MLYCKIYLFFELKNPHQQMILLETSVKEKWVSFFQKANHNNILGIKLVKLIYDIILGGIKSQNRVYGGVYNHPLFRLLKQQIKQGT
eukprot:UN01638